MLSFFNTSCLILACSRLSPLFALIFLMVWHGSCFSDLQLCFFSGFKNLAVFFVCVISSSRRLGDGAEKYTPIQDPSIKKQSITTYGRTYHGPLWFLQIAHVLRNWHQTNIQDVITPRPISFPSIGACTGIISLDFTRAKNRRADLI